MIAQRFIVPPNPATPYTQSPGVQAYVGVNVDGATTQPVPFEDPPPVADLYDVIVSPLTPPPSPYYYHAELQDDGTIIVKRDLFGPGVFRHTYAGWPVPGDPPPDQPIPAATNVPGLSLPPAWQAP